MIDIIDDNDNKKISESLISQLKSRKAKIGIIGLGYVGLPLGLNYAENGYKVIGFDIDESKIDHLKNKRSYISTIKQERIKVSISNLTFEATSDFKKISQTDAIIICVPHQEFLDMGIKRIRSFRKSNALIFDVKSVFPERFVDLSL